MALPQAVQQQVDEADRLAAELNLDKTNNMETNLNPDPDPNPAAEPKDNVIEEQRKQADPVPDDAWSQRYHTLKGMYDAEVPRLHAQVRELNTQVQTLIGDLERIKVQQYETAKPSESLITEQDREAFGPDLIDLMERTARSTVSNPQKELELVQEINKLKSQLNSVQEKQVVSDKDRFVNGLAEQVPDWESLNVNQGFLEWLQQIDPIYGFPRQVALTNAYENLEVTRVANIFNAYKSLVPSKQAKQLNPELQRQVAPTRSRSTTQPGDQQNERYFSEWEIGQFYEDWRRGLLDNDEALKMEKEISIAVANGRIR